MSKKDYLKYFEFKRDCVLDVQGINGYNAAIRFFKECGFETHKQMCQEEYREVVRKHITNQIEEIFYSLPENEQFELMMLGLHPTDCPLWKTEENDRT